MKNDFGIIVFGHTRPLYISDVLKSLQMQGAIGEVNVWLDGHQGAPDLKYKTDLVAKAVSKYSVRRIFKHNGALGFRKILLQALLFAVHKYKYIMVLEDDCFPTENAVSIFKSELENIAEDKNIFSIYGHPFLVSAEKETCTRFQGWGWGTTSERLKPFLEKLIYLYSINEKDYLLHVKKLLTPEIKKRLDVTPPRQPTDTLLRFFAWDETLALLTAIAGLEHKRTSVRTIYNFGACKDSSRFKDVYRYRKPPFNMISHEEVWDYF